jgi:hypothetical protein
MTPQAPINCRCPSGSRRGFFETRFRKVEEPKKTGAEAPVLVRKNEVDQ